MHSLKMIFPIDREEKTINARQHGNILAARPSEPATFQRRVNESPELIKSENSNIADDSLPLG